DTHGAASCRLPHHVATLRPAVKTPGAAVRARRRDRRRARRRRRHRRTCGKGSQAQRRAPARRAYPLEKTSEGGRIMNRPIEGVRIVAACAALALPASHAIAQPQPGPAPDGWTVPRTAWGDPDLRGMWPLDLGRT